MDPVQIYGLAAGGIFLVAILYRASSYISRWIQKRTLFYVFRYLVYPFLIRRNRLFTPFSRWHALLTVVYWSGTAVCNIVGVNTVAQAGSRAGSLAALHLIPLLFANRAAFASDLLGFSLQEYLRLHSSFGVMALVQSLIHIVIFLTGNNLQARDHLQFYGLLGASSFATLTLLSILRRPLFEFFQKTHYGLALLVAYAVWRHLSIKPVFSRFYIIIAGSIFSLTTMARYSRLVLRNIRWQRPWATTKLISTGDAIRVQINTPRPWNVRAGQYVYLWMPGTSFWSPFQSHPFMISWWDHDVQGEVDSIYLLVKPESGFTRRLTSHVGSCEMKAWIDGPYGSIIDVGDYGSVIMLASGIGIAAQVPYIKELLKDYGEFRVRTQSILLIWQLDKECDQDWVRDWMTELLEKDRSYILKIRLYVLGHFDDNNTKWGDKERHGSTNSLNKLYGKPDLHEIIRSEVQGKSGKVLITTSTESEMQDQVQDIVRSHLGRVDLKLLHLVFQPQGSRSFWSPKQPAVPFQGVV